MIESMLKIESEQFEQLLNIQLLPRVITMNNKQFLSNNLSTCMHDYKLGYIHTQVDLQIKNLIDLLHDDGQYAIQNVQLQ